MPLPPPLATDTEVENALARLRGWHRVGGSIHCRYRFGAFTVAVQFTTRMAAVAEELDHHPEWTVRYRTVDVVSSTHDSGGLTALDLTLATRIAELAAACGGHGETATGHEGP